MERLKRLTQELMLPPPLEVNFAAIPEVIQARHQWVVWTYRMTDGEIKKPPHSPRSGKLASVTSPDTWGSFAEAQSSYATGKYGGVGFVLTQGIVGIDIDHCIEHKQINEEATLLAAAMQTYTELSPSGTGLHLLMEGSLPGRYRRKGNIEMYETGRYLTVTGQSVQEPPLPLSTNQPSLAAAYQHLFSELERRENTGVREARRAEYQQPLHRTDEEVLEKAYGAKNGQTFRRYYEGDYSCLRAKALDTEATARQISL